MTVPNLMQNWKKQERLTQLKVAYSILQNATKMAVALNGHPSTWDFGERANTLEQRSEIYATKNFIPYVKTKDNGQLIANYNSYTIYSIHKELYQGVGTRSYAVMLENGMLVLITTLGYNGLSSNMARFMVDLNGFKGPNILGNDIFMFKFRTRTNQLTPAQPSSETTSCSLSNKNEPGHYCAYKIWENGWQFPDDYPIKKF